VWEASQAAAAAIQQRQTLIDAMPLVLPGSVPTPPPPTVPASPAIARADDILVQQAAARAAGGASSQVSVQSVLAAAGAGLFAVAAIVFTFFNPDVDYAARTTIIAIVTALFLGGAWLFAARGLRFSAEAVGALGMVFLALDVWAFADAAPEGMNGWTFAAIGTLVAASLMIAVSALVRLRSWLFLSIVALPLVPAFLGYATENWWGASIGHLAAAFAALGAHELLRRLAPRFGSALKPERVAATVVQFVAAGLVVAAAPFLDRPAGDVVWTVGVAALLGGLAVMAGLATRNEAPRTWSVLTGVFAASAIGILPTASDQDDWLVALVPLAAGVALAAGSLVRETGPIRRLPLLLGALGVTLVAIAPAVFVAVALLFASPFAAVAPLLATQSRTVHLATVIGLAAVAAASWVLSRRVDGVFARSAALLARWLAAGSVLTLALWPTLGEVWRVVTTLALALLAGLAVILVPRIRASATSLRAPLIVLAHVGVVVGVAMSWTDATLAVIAGAAALGVLVVVARTVGAAARPAYMAVGFAYSLLIVGTALNEFVPDLATLPILCLTATFGAVVALVATLTPWLRPGTWYAVLAVSTIPFVIAVFALFVEIRGWTALSTGVFFLLALALVLTRREGLTIFLRAAAAALLVPSLSVVVIAVGAEIREQWVEVSTSPYTLPIIAVIVAVTLAAGRLIANGLVRNGLSEAHARVVRFWIELSALVTGAIAVLLSITRDAAGLKTTFLVFLIIGIGAAAAAVWSKRLYWVVAGISWTGALWTALSLAGVEPIVIEPYALPPALAAALIGGMLVVRGHKAAIALYAAGLAAALVPSLLVLAFSGSGPDAVLPWRAFGLLAGSAVLLGVGMLSRGRGDEPGRAAPLVRPTLLLAIAAAAAGAIQGARYGWALDELPPALDPEYVMLSVLALALVATALAAAAGRVGVTRVGPETASRWWYAAATVYLVAGPWTAIGPAPLEVWTLWALMIVLLGVMVLTVLRARVGDVRLSPVWFTFGLAWVTAVVGWSQREIFRVEGWSLVLGGALLLVGVLGMPAFARVQTKATANSWPVGFRGSWKLLAPGIVVTLLPSMIATFTDPATWRAILVIALALVAVLAGAFLRLRAPFILGLSALGLEVLFVFVIQFRTGIDAVLWWITLATVGAVLLAIAVRSERRTGRDAGVGARLRDLE
jgi:hypothetical protein